MNEAVQDRQAARHGKAARWAALVGTTIALAAIAAFASGPGGYAARIVTLEARATLPREVYAAAGDSPQLRALFLDAGDHPQLVARMKFALLDYPQDARNVLVAFGGDEDFQQALLDYGERIIPVIAYFQKTDLATMKLRFDFARGWNKMLGKGEVDAGKSYGPEYRGLFAIEAIHQEGHKFLAQFRIDEQGAVHWLMTPQVTTFISEFFTSGIAQVEEKVRLRQQLAVSDLASGTVDVVGGLGFLKLLRLAKPAEALTATGRVGRAGLAAQPVTMAEKTTLYGGRVLSRDRVVRALKLGGTAAVVCITVRHPSLLSGLFEDIGAWLGLNAWVSKLIGWALLLAPLVIWLLPAALAAASALIPMVLALARLGTWLRGRPAAR